jgi:hypothetical protein
MIRVLKKVRRGLVDGHGARTGCGIGDLTGMYRKSGKLLLLGFGHDDSLALSGWGAPGSVRVGAATFAPDLGWRQRVAYKTIASAENEMSQIGNPDVTATGDRIRRHIF